MKKENVVWKILNTPVVVDNKIITDIYFDLKHIHYGWDRQKRDYKEGPARNNYSEDEIVGFFEQLNVIKQKPRAQTTHLKSVAYRYAVYVFDGNKRLTMVVDFMKNDATIVVTVY